MIKRVSLRMAIIPIRSQRRSEENLEMHATIITLNRDSKSSIKPEFTEFWLQEQTFRILPIRHKHKVLLEMFYRSAYDNKVGRYLPTRSIEGGQVPYQTTRRRRPHKRRQIDLWRQVQNMQVSKVYFAKFSRLFPTM